ncbi:MAG TPA: PQQ-dependent dehydrogenase, methanol/ethanol family [Thermoanaerobaculia bacterium]|nr:PQQ-dependent dehydrogenase, methanol/ethanol family [Thermoanaerobaculia bacterium]
MLGILAVSWPSLARQLEVGSAGNAASEVEARTVGAWVNDEALARAGGVREGWLTHGRTYSEQRFSELDQVDDSNVAKLGLAWSFPTGTRRGIEATPIVVDGVMFLTAPWSVVHALDARTGEELWRFDPEVPRSYASKACCDVVNRGVALYRGRVFVGTLDGRLVALEAATGKVEWDVVTVDQSVPYTITGAPRVVRGKVIIGNGGAEYGVRGYVSAYDWQTGELVWRTYTVPGDPSKGFESEAMRRAAETWTGEWWTVGGGGTVWDSMAFDPELDLIYIGTGNGSPWNRHVRSPGGGDNLYLSAILALRAETGELVWHYQTTPGDSWDYTATQHIVLADLEIAGRQRKVAMQAPKNGFFYVLDRATGELISAEAYVPVTWAERVDLATGRPVEHPSADYRYRDAVVLPSALGGHNWQPMSFHPGTGLVYLPAQERAAAYAHDGDFTYNPNTWNTGTRRAGPEAVQEAQARPVRAFLLAWDPVAQRERWRVEMAGYWNGGVLSTAGNLVFHGRSDGFLVAYRATDGEELWKAWAATGIIAAPISYELDGVQFVTVAAGWGGAFGLQQPDPAGSGLADPGQVVTFQLGGRAAASAATASGGAAAPSPASLPAIPDVGGDARVSEGERLYGAWCSACHGVEATGGGIVPDLRRSSRSTFADYPAIVLEGSRQDGGMPSLKGKLDAAEVAAIRSYVIQRRNVLAGRSG